MATLVLGASPKPSRYSYKATKRLLAAGEEVVLLGATESVIDGIPIQTGKPNLKHIETVTLYVGQHRQEEYIDYLIGVVMPRRIIFNPGTENPKLAVMASEAGIEVLHACTLVMLATNQY